MFLFVMKRAIKAFEVVLVNNCIMKLKQLWYGVGWLVFGTCVTKVYLKIKILKLLFSYL